MSESQIQSPVQTTAPTEAAADGFDVPVRAVRRGYASPAALRTALRLTFGRASATPAALGSDDSVRIGALTWRFGRAAGFDGVNLGVIRLPWRGTLESFEAAARTADRLGAALVGRDGRPAGDDGVVRLFSAFIAEREARFGAEAYMRGDYAVRVPTVGYVRSCLAVWL